MDCCCHQAQERESVVRSTYTSGQQAVRHANQIRTRAQESETLQETRITNHGASCPGLLSTVDPHFRTYRSFRPTEWSYLKNVQFYSLNTKLL